MFPVSVENRTIMVKAASGVITSDHFLLYLSLREKHAVAEVVCLNPTIIVLRANEDTCRYADDHDTRVEIDLDGPSTRVTLPSGWTVEASVSRYTCVIVGVRTPASEQLNNVPLNFVTSDDAAVRTACLTA